MHRAAAALLLVLVWAAPARAVLDDDETEAPPPPTPTVTVCEDGEVWDAAASACVAPESGALDEDRLFAAARALAYAGRYDAIRAARAMDAADGARALTVQGYAHRKAGRIDEGLRLYDAALARDPGNHLARSYLGRHHVDEGDLVAARAQLLEIEARGGAETWPYRALREAIMDHTGAY